MKASKMMHCFFQQIKGFWLKFFAMRQIKITQNMARCNEESIESYLAEISKERMITPEEEVELAQRIHNGDREALDKLVRANLRFVVSVAKLYQNQGLSLSDLISEGNIGLVKAAERFDATRGNKFISYAVWWIRQSIMQAISKQARIDLLPDDQDDLIRQIQNRMDTELDAADASLNNASLHVELDDLLKGLLKEREALIIKETFGIGCRPKSLEEVRLELGLTRERVRQIRNRALLKIRHSPKAMQLLSSL